MRALASVIIFGTLLPGLAHAQAIIVSPGYPAAPYQGGGFASPFAPGMSRFSGSGVATGAYPPGAQICVAADESCRASTPNTVGASCTCPGRDGRPTFGIVH